MKSTQLKLLTVIGLVLEITIVLMLILHIKHPVFPVLTCIWGFIAGILILNIRSLRVWQK